MNAALETLRLETRALHAALEDTPTLRAATERPGDSAAHAAYLTALAIGVRPLVIALHAAPPVALSRFLPGLEAWAMIDVDLASLGCTTPAALAKLTPARLDEDAAWGRLYVVRGAEAGVAMLARQNVKYSGNSALPVGFATALGARRSEWPALCAALGALLPTSAQRAAAAAREDFRFVLGAIQAWEDTKARELAA